MANRFMQLAITEAKKNNEDIPIGAIIVKNNEIIASAHNTKEVNNNVTAHAEMIALQEACSKLNNWRLNDCDIYITLEPCPMCGWAIMQARIRNIYFGSYDQNYGAFTKAKLNKLATHKPNIYGGICEQECNELLNDFFRTKRNISG